MEKQISTEVQDDSFLARMEENNTSQKDSQNDLSQAIDVNERLNRTEVQDFGEAPEISFEQYQQPKSPKQPPRQVLPRPQLPFRPPQPGI